MGTTNYLDPTNRSLLTEVKVPNVTEADGSFALLPGMYVQVVFNVARDTPPLMVPAPALVTTAEGTQVAVAKDGQRAFSEGDDRPGLRQRDRDRRGRRPATSRSSPTPASGSPRGEGRDRPDRRNA